MRVLSDSDYKLFERLVSLSQKELKKAMSQYLKAKYDNVIFTKDYLVAIGDIPVALVAHLDTVYRTPVSNLYYDQRKGVLWSPDGLGADDRAGVFAILRIIQDGYRPLFGQAQLYQEFPRYAQERFYRMERHERV